MSGPAGKVAIEGPVILGREAPFTLGRLSVDPARRCVIVDGGAEQTIEPRVMQVLVALSRARGGTVTRDEIMRDCWPGMVVGEDSLSRAISRLRRLVDASDGSVELQTVPRVGYRLLEHRTTRGGSAPAAKPSIIVLPFANISEDPEQEYFSDGTTEDIITDLTKVSAVSVVARNTSFALKGAHIEIPEIVARLGVSHVLEGAVRKVGDRLRITARLVDGAAGDQIWAERWDRDLTDIFAVQDEISRAVVSALKLKFQPEDMPAAVRRGTYSHKAYDLYLMAREFVVTGNAGDPRREEAIIRLCRQATQIDPSYARAWALLALAQTSLSVNRAKGVETGLAAAERASRLDPKLGSPHAVRAEVLYEAGDREGALDEIDRALKLEGDAYEVAYVAGRIYGSERRFSEAALHWMKAAEINSNDFAAAGMAIHLLASAGDGAGARRAAEMCLERAERVVAQDRANGHAMSFGATALVFLGQIERTRQWIDRALLVDPDNFLMRYNFACALATSPDDNDLVIDLLDSVMRSNEGASFAKWAATDTSLDPVRGDPRVKTLLGEGTGALPPE
ncbi:MAG TPA: winged helix-turn-helix domain-containing protein [Caulobacteraceae bacterium]|jgi:adenylate cyclase